MTNLPSSTPRRNPERQEAYARLRATPLGEALAHARTAFENAPDSVSMVETFDELVGIWNRAKRTPEGKAYVKAGGEIV